MEEIWRDIKEYEGLYQVSNLGRIKGLNYTRAKKEHILKNSHNGRGYLKITLCKNKKLRTFQVHRLVAQAFIPNPLNLPQVNHKKEFEKNNNRVDNLEWCTQKYNLNYGTHNERIKKMFSKTVCQYSLDGEFIKEWSSTAECGRNGFTRSAVASCCRGENKKHKGYMWRYKNTEQVAK